MYDKNLVSYLVIYFIHHPYEFFSIATKVKRRRWAVNSIIINEKRDTVYFVDTTETSIPLLDMTQKGEFIALYGAQASGKSLQVDQVVAKLRSEGIVCI
jgi:hypothetical protein